MTQIDQLLKALYDEEREWLADDGTGDSGYLNGIRFAIRAAREVQRG